MAWLDTVKGAFSGFVDFAGDAAGWTSELVSDLSDIAGTVSDLVGSTGGTGSLVLDATTPGVSPTYLNPSSPPTVATSSDKTTLYVLGFLGVLGLIMYLELKK